MPKFIMDGMHKMCEVRQLGKHARHEFPHEKNVCKNPLEVTHFDVCGPIKGDSMCGCRYCALMHVC